MYFARDVAYTYTKASSAVPATQEEASFQAGLYPVSANVPLGGQTGATPDGRYGHIHLLQTVFHRSAGKDVNGPTASG